MKLLEKSKDDEIMEDDAYLKIIPMPLGILKSKKLNALEKLTMATLPDCDRITRNWDINGPDVARIPFPSWAFKDLTLEQCYLFGFVMHMHIVEESLGYKTTLKKLSKCLGMDSRNVYKDLNWLAKKGFLKKTVKNGRLILTMALPDDADPATTLKGSKILQMSETEALALLDATQ